MVVIYIIGSLFLLGMAVYFLAKSDMRIIKKDFQEKANQIEKINNRLDEIHQEMIGSEEILGKISSISYKILNYHK